MDLPAPLAILAARHAINVGGMDSSKMFALANRCRMIGELDLAAELFKRIAADENAETSVASFAGNASGVLNGDRIWQELDDGTASPVPFVRLLDFLPADLHARVKEMTADVIKDFRSSLYYEDGHGKLDTSKRISAILPDSSALSHAVIDKFQAAMEQHNIMERLGIEGGLSKHYEFQVTCSGNGAFFKPHTDSGKGANKNRRVTFVYYYNFDPKSFTGGNLKLFDGSVSRQQYSSSSYTTITPLDNSVVFFPSNQVHEVELVNSVDDDLIHGRFTLNGWFHRTDA